MKEWTRALMDRVKSIEEKGKGDEGCQGCGIMKQCCLWDLYPSSQGEISRAFPCLKIAFLSRNSY